MPAWALTLTYTLHLLATVGLLGGLFAFSFLVVPAAGQGPLPLPTIHLARRAWRRFQPVSWLCLAILAGTGMVQMSVHPAYQGFLAIDNAWSAALFVKHLAFGLMLLAFAYQTWFLWPSLERAAIRLADAPDDALARHARRQQRFIRLQAALGLLVLVLTAIAQTV